MFCLVPFAIALVFAYYGLVVDPTAEPICYVLFVSFYVVGLLIFALEYHSRRR